jgi:hypothetical protein
MASKWAGISDRFRIGLRIGFGPNVGPAHPPGTTSGRWILLGPVWVRLGSRSSWQDEDLDAEMIKPVKP